VGCHRLVCAFGLSFLLLLAPMTAVTAADGRPKQAGELGFQFGVVLPDQEMTGKPATLSNIAPTFGLRGDYEFSPHWGWFVDTTFSVLESVLDDDITTYAVRTGAEFFTSPHWTDYQTFFAFGGGWQGVDRQNATDFTRWFGSVSGGQRFTIGPNQLIRWELRVDQTVTDDGLDGVSLTSGMLLLGYTWGMPNRARDSDGDGVPDRKDDCPDTPRAAVVDRYGCALDTDRDTVPDGIDRCPGTPLGWAVDSTGCPLDSDDDGVSDGQDDCPGTPPGTTVDVRGCPLDTDGDGVHDGIDQCPGTPRGAIVDEVGCPLDGDEDGVPDGIDECPDTPPFAHVDERGCPLDSDEDGVYDGIDRCPQTPLGTAVDEFGCPLALPLFEARTQLVLDGVFFELNSTQLTLNSAEILDGVAASMLAWPEARVEVGGFTDTSGNAAYNMDLSRRRAESVRSYLIGQGVPPEQVTAHGYGEALPIADNSTREGRVRNRRVELKRLD
jgi:outer membrane protein OmpA-like peptidoglycan-associated protein